MAAPEESAVPNRVADEASVPTDVVPPLDFDSSMIDRFVLHVTEGASVGRTYSSTRERTVIGTHKSADFVLEDAAVSRFHCEITIVNGRARIHDLGSRNGTVVDGVHVETAYLAPTSIIKIGRTELRFELRGDQVEVLLAPQEQFGPMVGRSQAMRAVFALLKSASFGTANALLEGETGTGKGLAAVSIHMESDRRDEPFVVVDCASTPGAVLERELFGQGANPGAFERAQGGTLLLDEVSGLDDERQSRLLRALTSGEVRRIGSGTSIPLNVRVIATSSANLRREVNARRFRSDLYYALAVIDIALPPVRERADDIPLLVAHVLDGIGATDHPAAAELQTPKRLEELAQHSWPGNVHELRHYVERCVALHQLVPLETEPVEELDRMPEIDIDAPLRASRERWVRYFERQYLGELLERHGQNVSAAARAAGIDRVHMHRLLSRVRLR